ncbi:hypothetical protein CJ255_15655 [Candidatus Viridilinea mediisalina]|uniref:CopG family transcriptional regulator n=2 Tax=Candidatus Viridilinea mediisalina TaxID=2024553 RepID=A0A2A6RGH4_9CHLR|nr:hypothetical protein CJ255_15655 [Candidatus Viridilinea mediisalina]
MSIVLTPYLKQWVESRVASGRYNDVSEVMREAVRLLEQHELEREARLRDLSIAIQEGLSSPAKPWEGAEAIIRQSRLERGVGE